MQPANAPQRPSVHVVGRFPPPVDGQTLATARLTALLEPAYRVRRFDTAYKDQALLPASWRQRWVTLRHYLRLRRRLRWALANDADAPVLWCAASPAVAGHWRDMALTAPCFQRRQAVYAIIHRGHFDRVFRRALTGPTARHLAARVQGFVFLSEALAAQVDRWVPPEKLFVIPNTIDHALVCTKEELAQKRASRAARTTLRLLFLSNMIASKGYLDVLQAVHLLNQRGIPIQATFVGRWNSNADRDAFLRRVEAYGAQRVVTHLGALSDRAQIKKQHLAADVLLLPTYYPEEAQPLALLEALGAGTPVIVTRHSSIPEFVRDGREALFVAPRAPEEIARSVERLLVTETWLHASHDARQRFERRFSASVIRDAWLALLRNS